MFDGIREDFDLINQNYKAKTCHQQKNCSFSLFVGQLLYGETKQDNSSRFNQSFKLYCCQILLFSYVGICYNSDVVVLDGEICKEWQ